MASTLLVSSPTAQRRGIAVLRVVIGIVFLLHGYQKVFVYGFAGTAGAFGKMGIFMPGVMGPFIALLELLGGLALIVGLLTRLAALGLACDMLGAIMMVHLAGGFFLPAGFEYALTLLAGCVAVMLAGPGAASVDEAIGARSVTPLDGRDHLGTRSPASTT